MQNQTTDLIPPFSAEAEAVVLGSCIMDDRKFSEAAADLRPEHFYSSANQKIFTAMIEKKTTDIITLSTALPDESTYLAELCDLITTNITGSIKIILDCYSRRKIIQHSYNAINKAFNMEESKAVDISNELHKNLYDSFVSSGSNNLITMRELLPELFDASEKLMKKAAADIKTGLIEVDNSVFITNGDLVIIAGRPSMGKSAFADSIIRYNATKEKKTVLCFSVEMSRQIFGMRSLCSEAGVSYHLLRSGLLPKRDLPKLSFGTGPLREASIFIDDTPAINIFEITKKCNLVKSQSDLHLIIVDYMQLMGSISQRGTSREQEVSQISRGLKNIARTFGCPVIALSQLSRKVEERKPEPIPVLSDLRESGAIEQDADIVLFPYRKEYYFKKDDSCRGLADIICAKQRNGPTGTMHVLFEESTMRFLNKSDISDERRFYD